MEGEVEDWVGGGRVEKELRKGGEEKGKGEIGGIEEGRQIDVW